MNRRHFALPVVILSFLASVVFLSCTNSDDNPTSPDDTTTQDTTTQDTTTQDTTTQDTTTAEPSYWDLENKLHNSVNTQPSNQIDIFFQVFDSEGLGVPGLGKSDFEVQEDETAVSPTESNMQIEGAEELNYRINTVLVLDNSRSISDSDIRTIQQRAHAFVDSMHSKQYIAVLAFSEQVRTLQEFNQDMSLLHEAIDAIDDFRYQSTDLYGAVIEAVNMVETDYSFQTIADTIVEGNVVLFTDGDDTQGRNTLSQALSARDRNNPDVPVYTIGLGSEINPDALEDLGNAGYFPAANASALEARFNEIQRAIGLYVRSFYYLHYNSPTRGDNTHTLKLYMPENKNTGSSSYITAQFNSKTFASGFAPEARDTSIVGQLFTGDTLKGRYSYYDKDDPAEPEGETRFQWYRDGEEVDGLTDTTYLLTSADTGTLIGWSVVPVQEFGTPAEGDSVYVETDTIIQDSKPQAKIGRISSSVGLNNPVKFSADSSFDLNGVVEGIFWKFGSSDWVEVSDGDTTVKAPSSAGAWVCSLRVVDDDGEESFDEITLYVLEKNGSMVKIPGGTFNMGSTNGFSDEEPVHSVTVSSFWMDTTEVTQKQYSDVMAAAYSGYSDPSWGSSYGVGDDNPAYYVNWYDAVLYCNARTKASGSNDTVYSYTSISGTPGNDCVLVGLSIDLSKQGYRLPTEAEWEYACRGGKTTEYYWGSNSIGDHAWYPSNSGGTTHAVAQKLPNAYGLYDMSGNVWEWCNDWYGSYSRGSATNPAGPSSGSLRVLRGGSWAYIASYLRSANRGYDYPDYGHGYIGFRVALPAQ